MELHVSGGGIEQFSEVPERWIGYMRKKPMGILQYFFQDARRERRHVRRRVRTVREIIRYAGMETGLIHILANFTGYVHATHKTTRQTVRIEYRYNILELSQFIVRRRLQQGIRMR